MPAICCRCSINLLCPSTANQTPANAPVSSHQGVYISKEAGTIRLVWDNTASMFTSKIVAFSHESKPFVPDSRFSGTHAVADMQSHDEHPANSQIIGNYSLFDRSINDSSTIFLNIERMRGNTLLERPHIFTLLLISFTSFSFPFRRGSARADSRVQCARSSPKIAGMRMIYLILTLALALLLFCVFGSGFD